jgi:glycyl-tRNA synthetase beta chain
MKPLLLEIAVEEIPARFLPSTLRNLKEITSRVFADARVEVTGVNSHVTPRRLVVHVEGVADHQPDLTTEVVGPPASVGLDASGAYTKAALGFAKKQGIPGDALKVIETEKGTYVAAEVTEKGRPLPEILPELLARVVTSLTFPKSMRWSDGTMRFARPVHRFLALYGTGTVAFEVDGVTSGNVTYGHRFLAPAQITVTSPEEYFDAMKAHHVVISTDERMKLIAEQARALAATVGGEPVYDQDLLSHVACILEYPQAVLCGFDRKYLDLPDELLASVMVGHQKYFPVKATGTGGRLLEHFIVVSNTWAENAATVRAGAERVIRARFEDARFYFEEDRTVQLADRLEALKKVTFQDKLGTLFDKTQRIMTLAGEFSSLLCPDKTHMAVSAAEVAKADLITGVVREFPELQGIMGMYYARAEGAPEAVATAIREQYLPAFSGGPVPSTDVGAAVSLADRMDNIVSFFGIGLKPTGSEDPFALRRQALGVISILLEREYNVSLKALLSLTSACGTDAEHDVMAFFGQRLEPLLAARGYEIDLARAIMPFATAHPLGDMFKRLDALRAFKSTHEGYNEFLAAIKRVRNIIPADAGLPEVSDALFREEAERVLDSAFESVLRDVRLLVDQTDYPGAIGVMMKLNVPVNAFFEHVLVMDEDMAVRQNRLALLKEIWTLVSSIADFSQLSER